MQAAIATRAPKRPKPLHRPKAGEPIHAYGMADGSNSLRRGLGARERAVINRALDILGAYMRGPGDAFESATAVKQYMMLHLAGEPCEHFAVLYLDAQHRALAFERHAIGTIAQATVYPREVAFAALQHGAAAVVLAHNHPSGGVKASRADVDLTQTLKQALALVDVRVLDHVIVGGKQALSMAEQGLM